MSSPQEMSHKDPAFKLFGMKIPLPESHSPANSPAMVHIYTYIYINIDHLLLVVLAFGVLSSCFMFSWI